MHPNNPFPRPTDAISIAHGESVLLLGSCFSTHLNQYIRQAGFAVNSNPFGVVFHPVPLARFLLETLEGVPTERTLLRDDVWLSWDASSEVYAMSETELTQQLQTLREQFRKDLQTAKMLVVTLGSDHGYRLKSDGLLVANCHKVPGSGFAKELTEPAELTAAWERVIVLLQQLHPGLKMVFTVSPVRYSRDGWTENNRSKARLFELVGYLQQQFGVGYFPSFELVSDVLRDYRYFEVDGVHPNAQAIHQVWDLFQSWYFDEPTKALVQEVETLRRMESHRLLFPESVKSAEFRKQFNEKRESFLSLHPQIIW